MRYLKYKVTNNLKENKIIVLSILFLILLVGYIAIPTLSEDNNVNPTYTITAWDGTIAASYGGGEGTEENPYIISNGSELAYLASQLEEKIYYEEDYFVLENDIILNEGIFSYTKTDGIKYTKDNTENTITPNLENNIVKVFKHLNGFKGNFDGNGHSIYGLYIDESIDEQNALFTNLEGNISNLYIKNSIIYGGKVVAGVASKTNNSTLTNISYNGYVISDEEVNNKEITINIEDITKNVSNNELIDSVGINNLKYIPGIITNITLSGRYQTDNSDAILKINNQTIDSNEFEINLSNKLQTTIPINYQTNKESTFKLTDLTYKINYIYSNASGIVSIAKNTTLENIINKAYINAPVYASGIINTVVGNTSIKNAYNNGKIESSNTGSGLISNINQNNENVTITNCYNNGELISNNNAMIGNIENNAGTVTLSNTFNTQDNYGINLIDNTNVYINNSYIISDKSIKTGESDGKFTLTTLENLKNKAFVQENLKYKEYETMENSEDDAWIWTFDNDSLPILYIDELNIPIANIHVKEHLWNSYKKELEPVKFLENFVFSIEEVNELNPIKEIYYYISNEKEVLTKDEINTITDWKIYEHIVEIREEGFNTIYAKIVDNNNNIIYINTDLLILDLTKADITISAPQIEKTWKEFKTDLTSYYIDKKINIDIEAEDSISGIKKIYYHISDIELIEEDVEKIDNWNEYTESITITNEKTIIYVKVVDNYDYKTYANSDLIILNGYKLNRLSPGMNGESQENLYITDNSSVSMDFTYQDNNSYAEGKKHQIISNILLPQNTQITIIDKTNNRVYKYITTDSDYGYNDCVDEICEATYDFELFNEVSSKTKFQESNYTGIINEDFTIILDFKNATIDKNIENISIYLKLNNENSNEIRNTLIDSIKKFNIIYENSHSYFTLTSTFNNTINYNSNTKYTIDFKTKLNYMLLEENKIFDTTFEDKNIGLSIEMVNSNGNIVDKTHLKNIEFKIGDKKHSPSSDGIVRINLEKGISDVTDNLIIQTYSDNYKLESGNYKFIIGLYTAYDGVYSNKTLTSIEIPVYVGENTYNNDLDFSVNMNNEDKIITTNSNEFNFEFLVSEINENTNIRMSLYKKDELSAYNQKYTMIDLGEYLIDNTFEEYGENVYYASKNINANNTLNLNLNTDLLEKNGYMFVFELYDDEKLVNTINKKFIVK